MEEIYEETKDLQSNVINDLIYQKVHKLGGRTNKAISKFGIEDNQSKKHSQ